MTTREQLNEILDSLPDMRLYEVLDFARYLYWLEGRAREELEDWKRAGMTAFAKCYGPDEPEYTLDDVKPKQQP
jgi:hypothetical protein